MSIELSNILHWGERLLSLVGVLAVGTLAYRGFRHLVSTQKELSEVDQRVRSAYKEGWEAELRLRVSEQEQFRRREESFKNELTEAAQRIESQGSQLSRQDKWLEALIAGARFSLQLLNSNAQETDSRHSEVRHRLWHRIERIRTHIRSGTLLPPELFEPIVGETDELARCYYRLQTKGDMASKIVPQILDDMQAHPNLTTVELMQRVFDTLKRMEEDQKAELARLRALAEPQSTGEGHS